MVFIGVKVRGHGMKGKPLPPTYEAALPSFNAPLRRCQVPREQAGKRILIVRTGAHGDILMGTPLLTGLREAWPDAHITWVATPHEADAIRANPYVDELLIWDGLYWKRMLRSAQYALWAVRVLAFRRELHRRRFDIFISLEPEHWPLLTRCVGAAVRVGVFDIFRQWAGETQTSPLTRLYTNSFTHHDLPTHRTDEFLLPLKALGLPTPDPKKMTMGFTQEDSDVVNSFLSEKGLAEKTYVVIAPVTNWPSRCWPGERYAELGDALIANGQGVVLVAGARSEDREATARIVSQMHSRPALAISGALSFRQMAALVARATVLVSGDTGPMHVAAAVGTPYVALFGPTSIPARAPLAGRGITLMHPVPCGPCDQERCKNEGDDYMKCLRLLTVPEVLEAVSSCSATVEVVASG